ncbi:MAG: hypothetical protein RL385_3070 [Pseudomonadota bacterium]
MSFFAATNMGVPALASLGVGALCLRLPTGEALLALPVSLMLALGARSVWVRRGMPGMDWQGTAGERGA